MRRCQFSTCYFPLSFMEFLWHTRVIGKIAFFSLLPLAPPRVLLFSHSTKRSTHCVLLVRSNRSCVWFICLYGLPMRSLSLSRFHQAPELIFRVHSFHSSITFENRILCSFKLSVREKNEKSLNSGFGTGFSSSEVGKIGNHADTSCSLRILYDE